MEKKGKRKAGVGVSTRRNPGDVFEITTPKGFAYLQQVLRDPLMGDLVRVLPGIYESRPLGLNIVTDRKELFFTFFPVGAALARKIVRKIGASPLPVGLQSMPPMRNAGGRTPEGKVLNWRLLEGNEERLVEKLTEEQKDWSIRAIWNDTLLVERIIEGWMPRNLV